MTCRERPVNKPYFATTPFRAIIRPIRRKSLLHSKRPTAKPDRSFVTSNADSLFVPNIPNTERWHMRHNRVTSLRDFRMREPKGVCLMVLTGKRQIALTPRAAVLLARQQYRFVADIIKLSLVN